MVMLEGYCAWVIEATFAEARRHLGVETQRQWSDLAILRATPALLGLFSLVTLWAHPWMGPTAAIVRQATWYPKPRPTFSDALALVRRELRDLARIIHGRPGRVARRIHSAWPGWLSARRRRTRVAHW